MLGLLPILTFYFLFRWRQQAGQGRRLAFMESCLIWGSLCVLITETLSALSMVSFWPMTLAWSALMLLAGTKARWSLKSPLGKDDFATVDKFEKIILAIIAGFLIIEVFSLILTPPNNIDSALSIRSAIMPFRRLCRTQRNSFFLALSWPANFRHILEEEFKEAGWLFSKKSLGSSSAIGALDEEIMHNG